MSASAEQLTLLVSREPIRDEVPDSLVAKQGDMSKAIQLCINASGLDEKEIYMPLGIDSGHWTRICKGGKGHFPPNKLSALMTLCGNEIPLRWLAMDKGYELVRREDEKDKIIRTQANEINELKSELATLVKYGAIGRAK